MTASPVPAGRRARKKEATHTSIAEAAMRLFADRGYHRVTIEEIAEACDVSSRTFFRHFSSKEDVLFAGSEVRRARLLEALDAQPADATPFEVLEGAIRMWAAPHVHDRELFQARERIIESAPALQARDTQLPRQWDRDVANHLRETGRSGALSDLELRLVVGAAMTALRVAIDEWIRSDAELVDLLDTAFRRLAGGFAGEAPSPPPASAGDGPGDSTGDSPGDSTGDSPGDSTGDSPGDSAGDGR